MQIIPKLTLIFNENDKIYIDGDALYVSDYHDITHFYNGVEDTLIPNIIRGCKLSDLLQPVTKYKNQISAWTESYGHTVIFRW